VRKRYVAPILACISLAFPAGALAHAKSPTVALDYRIRLASPPAGVDVDVLDGDRSLRIGVDRNTLVVLGDLSEPMLRIGPDGAWANRASVTAQAARLATAGRGWVRVGGNPFAWHEHRLAPPPYDGGKTGAVARFAIPASLDGRKVTIGGTFVRYARPSPWPWFAGMLVGAAILGAVVWLRPQIRSPYVTALGTVAGAAALVALVTFGVADGPSGRVAWLQIALGCALAIAVLAGLVRLHGERRVVLAGLVGAAAAVSNIGTLGVFRHGVVISALPSSLSRTVCAVALAAGIAAAAAVAATHEGTR
jgi:hypothetical protein